MNAKCDYCLSKTSVFRSTVQCMYHFKTQYTDVDQTDRLSSVSYIYFPFIWSVPQCSIGHGDKTWIVQLYTHLHRRYIFIKLRNWVKNKLVRLNLISTFLLTSKLKKKNEVPVLSQGSEGYCICMPGYSSMIFLKMLEPFSLYYTYI